MANLQLLDNLQSKAPDNQFNVDDIKNAPIQGLTPAQEQAWNQQQLAQQPTRGVLNNNEYYPTINHNIGVGSLSTSGAGLSISGTQYAPASALVPLGMMDARDAAVHGAALKKAKEVEDFKNKFKSPTSKLTNINDGLRNQYYSFINNSWDQAMKKAGGDQRKAQFILEQDPNFHQQEQSYQHLAKNYDATVEKIAKDDEDIKSGKFTATPDYLEAKKKMLQGLNPNDPEFKNLSHNFNAMHVERDFSDALNDTTKKLVADKHGYAYDNLDSNEFKKIYEGETSSWGKEQKDAIANHLIENIYKGSDYHTPEKIRSDVNALLSGKQETKKMSAVQTREEDANDIYNENDIVKEPSSTNIYTKNTGKNVLAGTPDKEGNITSTFQPGTSSVGESISDYGVSHKVPIKAIVPNGRTLYINDADHGMIKTSEVNPNANVLLQKTKLMKVYDGPAKEHQGTPLTEQQIKEGRPFKWQTMTEMTITEGKSAEQTQKTAYIPASEVENYLVKKRNAKTNAVEKGIPVDKLDAERDARNKALGTTNKVSKTVTTKKDPLGLGL